MFSQILELFIDPYLGTPNVGESPLFGQAITSRMQKLVMPLEN